MRLVHTVFEVTITGLPSFPGNRAYVALLGSERGLRRLALPQSTPEAALEALGKAVAGSTRDGSGFADLQGQIKRYFKGEVKTFTARLDLSGATPFQRQAWEVISTVPYGETGSYAWVARQMAKPGAARGVGRPWPGTRCP